jgi:hypothetical protein
VYVAQPPVRDRDTGTVEIEKDHRAHTLFDKNSTRIENEKSRGCDKGMKNTEASPIIDLKPTVARPAYLLQVASPW